MRGALEAIRAVPGLLMLILLAAFNNLLGGVFLTLMDAYGLTLVSVETWGLLFGFIGVAFILGGLIVARRGLGPVPVRVVLLGNMVNWFVCATFTLRPSVVLLTLGMFVWLLLIPVIDAAEQTVRCNGRSRSSGRGGCAGSPSSWRTPRHPSRPS